MTEGEQQSSSALGQGRPTENPFGPFNVSVLVPDNIEIRMVDASALSEYEFWFFLASLLSNIAVGFLVAYVQAGAGSSATKSYVGYTALAFGILFLTAIARALVLRYILRKKSKTVRLGVSSAAVEGSNEGI